MSNKCTEPSSRTGYAINTLDRLSSRREDPAFIAELMAAPETRWFVIGKDRPALKTTDGGPEPLFSLDEVRALGRVRDSVLLGRDSERAYFAALLDDGAILAREIADEGAFIDTRQLVIPGRPDILLQDLRAITMEGALPARQIGALGQAKSLLYWHARHRFCSMCGGRTEVAAAGYRRDCQACGSQHFPRTDPVVIMLAVRGDHCLLGRQPRFNKGMYSALAGFLEPGETMETAVRREILEESAIEVGAVAYYASQPWPFPSSIMIGCIAEAITTTIEIDRTELEDCRWFTRADVEAMFARTHPGGYLAPNSAAIASHLLRAWMNRETPQF
jgi:NAD+ diphosphatase